MLKSRFYKTIICGKSMLSGIEVFKKILDFNFVCIFKEFPGFFQDIFIIFFLPGNEFFSFSRFSSVRGNSEGFLINYYTQFTNLGCKMIP